jgi:hypothetical protein
MGLPTLQADRSNLLYWGKRNGIIYAVTHNGLGYRCGYVRLNPEHVWHGMGYDEIPCAVHGGLTYCGHDTESKDYWIGFDCAHSFDAQDPSLPSDVKLDSYASTSAIVRDLEYVKDQCRQLCDQASLANTLHTLSQITTTTGETK